MTQREQGRQQADRFSEIARTAALALQEAGLLWSSETQEQLGGEPFDLVAQVDQVTSVINQTIRAAADDALNLEDALREIRELVGPEPQVCVGIRDCGEETTTLRGTTVEYDAQIGMNGVDFVGDSVAEILAAVRAYKKGPCEG